MPLTPSRPPNHLQLAASALALLSLMPTGHARAKHPHTPPLLCQQDNKWVACPDTAAPEAKAQKPAPPTKGFQAKAGKSSPAANAKASANTGQAGSTAKD